MPKVLLNIPDEIHKTAKKKYKKQGYVSVSEMYRNILRTSLVLEDSPDGVAQNVEKINRVIAEKEKELGQDYYNDSESLITAVAHED